MRALKIALAVPLAVATALVYLGAVALGRAAFDLAGFLLHSLAEWVAGV